MSNRQLTIETCQALFKKRAVVFLILEYSALLLCPSLGSYGSWKSWKVLEFYLGIFQDIQVLESSEDL